MTSTDRRSSTDDDRTYETQFTRENTWRTFKMTLFAALSGATFIAALGVLAQKIIGAAEGIGTTTASGTSMSTSVIPSTFVGSLFTNPLLTIPLLLGMIVVGVVAAYVSTSEGTEIKRLQDDRLARKNAQEQQRCQSRNKSNDIEYSHNQRADGKAWCETLVNQPTERTR